MAQSCVMSAVCKFDLERDALVARAMKGDTEAQFVLGVGYSAGNHLGILDHNERITNNLIHVLSRKPVAWLLVTSSSCVYPDDGPDTVAELPLFTGEPEMANWGYGWAKRMLEQNHIDGCHEGVRRYQHFISRPNINGVQ